MLIGPLSTRQNYYISDDFNTNSSNRETTSSGHQWFVTNGTFSSNNGNGVLTPNDPNVDYNLAMAYVNAPYGNAEIIVKDLTNNTGVVWHLSDDNQGFYMAQKIVTPSQQIILFGGKNPSTGAWQHPAQMIYATEGGSGININTIKIQILKSSQYAIRYWLYQDSAMTNLINSSSGTYLAMNSQMTWQIPLKPKYGVLCMKNTSYYLYSVPGLNIGDFSLTSTP